MDELDNIIILTDEAGKDFSFEFLDEIEYQGNEYVILLPADRVYDKSIEVVILMVKGTDDSDVKSYIGVKNNETLDAVFGIFKEKIQDGFDDSLSNIV